MIRTSFANICERKRRQRYLLLINPRPTLINDEWYTRITKCYGNIGERHIFFKVGDGGVSDKTCKRDGNLLKLCKLDIKLTDDYERRR